MTVETGERLAAYLSGDLDADERQALEAELARDARLRSQLERIQAADAALLALPEVTPRAGFSERLHAAVAAEVEQQLGDELAARRERRQRRWMPIAGAAAAGLVFVAAGVGIVTGLGGDDTGGDMADGGAESAVTMLAPENGGRVAGDLTPVIVAFDRTLGADDLAALAADPRFEAELVQRLAEDDALAYAARNAEAYGEAAPPEAGADTSAESAPALDVAGATVIVEGNVSEADRAAVAACLPVLSEGAETPVVPLYVEIAEDTDGRDVLVYALLGRNADGDYDRIEVWMLDRATCDVLHFVQSDR
jgi:negative regulator of sigma E activity